MTYSLNIHKHILLRSIKKQIIRIGLGNVKRFSFFLDEISCKTLNCKRDDDIKYYKNNFFPEKHKSIGIL